MAALDDLSKTLSAFGSDDPKDPKRSDIRVDIANLENGFTKLDLNDVDEAKILQKRANTLIDDLVKQTKATEADVAHRVAGSGAALDTLAGIMKKADPSKDIADMSDDELRKNFAKVVGDAAGADHPGFKLDAAAQAPQVGAQAPQVPATGKRTLNDIANAANSIDPDLAQTMKDMNLLVQAEKMTGQDKTNAIQQIESDLQNRAAKENFGLQNQGRQSDIQAAVQALEQVKAGGDATNAEKIMAAVARDEYEKAGLNAEAALTTGGRWGAAVDAATATRTLDGIKALEGQHATDVFNADAKNAAQHGGQFDRTNAARQDIINNGFMKDVLDAVKNTKDVIGVPHAQNQDPNVQAPVVAQVKSQSTGIEGHG